MHQFGAESAEEVPEVLGCEQVVAVIVSCRSSSRVVFVGSSVTRRIVDGILFRDPNKQRGTRALRAGDGSSGQKKTYRGPEISRRNLAVAVREVRRYHE